MSSLPDQSSAGHSSGKADPQEKQLLIARGIWGTLSRLPDPTLLISATGFDVLALNAAANRFFDNNASTAQAKRVLEASLSPLLIERLCLAARSGAHALVSELPAQITLAAGRACEVQLTVMPIPGQRSLGLAVLHLRVAPSLPQSDAFFTLPPELLSLLPHPAWLVEPNGVVRFQNQRCRDLPVQQAGGLVDVEAVLNYQSENSGQESCGRAIRETWTQAGATGRVAYRLVTLNGQVWRIMHTPVQGVDREKYIFGMALLISKDIAGVRQELADLTAYEPDSRRRLQLRERERERMKLAREVHDSLGQELTVLRLGLDSFFNLITAELPVQARHKRQFEMLKGQMQQVIQSSRQIAGQLRTDVLQQSGLLHAVELLVMQFRQRLGIPGQLEVSSAWVDPEPTLASNIYRSVQELLNNMAKHARANKFIVRMKLFGGVYEIEVADDGVGLQSELKQGHLGLRTTLERVENHQGDMQLRTRPEVDGTSILLTFFNTAHEPVDTNF